MTTCDAALIGLGQYGTGIFENLDLGKMFDDDQMNMLADCKLSKHHEQTLSYFLTGDEIFPLKKWLLQTYPGKYASVEERIYN